MCSFGFLNQLNASLYVSLLSKKSCKQIIFTNQLNKTPLRFLRISLVLIQDTHNKQMTGKPIQHRKLEETCLYLISHKNSRKNSFELLSAMCISKTVVLGLNHEILHVKLGHAVHSFKRLTILTCWWKESLKILYRFKMVGINVNHVSIHRAHM